jgi:hypothetical protein
MRTATRVITAVTAVITMSVRVIATVTRASRLHTVVAYAAAI